MRSRKVRGAEAAWELRMSHRTPRMERGRGLRLLLDPRKVSSRPRPPVGGVLPGHALGPPLYSSTHQTHRRLCPPPRLGDFEKDVPRPSLGWGGGAPSPELTLNPRYSDAARPGVCQPKLGHTTRGPPRRVERIEGR